MGYIIIEDSYMIHAFYSLPDESMARRILCGYYLEFLIRGLVFICGGMLSPNRNPQGLRGSIWSKMSLTIPVIGIAKNIPGMPHSVPNARTAVMETRALIFTFEATILGTI